MTLRDTIKSALLTILEWAKRNRDYFGDMKARMEIKLDEERKFQQLRKEYSDKQKRGE